MKLDPLVDGRMPIFESRTIVWQTEDSDQERVFSALPWTFMLAKSAFHQFAHPDCGPHFAAAHENIQEMRASALKFETFTRRRT